MPRFPSPEWMEQFCERLVAQPDAGEVAASLDGVYRFVVQPAGALTQPHSYDVEIRPADGDRAHAALLEGETHHPRLVLTATYDRWKQLITGTLDVGMALMLRRLKVSGDLSGLMRDVSTTRPLLRALGEVDSEWVEA